jgi:hypothetical protein
MPATRSSAGGPREGDPHQLFSRCDYDSKDTNRMATATCNQGEETRRAVTICPEWNFRPILIGEGGHIEIEGYPRFVNLPNAAHGSGAGPRFGAYFAYAQRNWTMIAGGACSIQTRFGHHKAQHVLVADDGVVPLAYFSLSGEGNTACRQPSNSPNSLTAPSAAGSQVSCKYLNRECATHDLTRTA